MSKGAGDGKGQDAITERYAYDSNGNLTQQTNGQGNTASATYNSQGLPLAVTNALGQTQTNTYDAAGNLNPRAYRGLAR